MSEKLINRKAFVKKAVRGLAGLSILPGNISWNDIVPMEKRNMGKTGIMVTPLCFGAPRTSEESLVKYAVSKGLNFIDTGRSYSNGNNEILVGRAVAGIRKNIVIQTKLKLEYNELMSKGKGKKGADEIKDVLSYKLEGSLKALNTDHIDVVLYHNASEEDLLFHPATLRFFDDNKRNGAIRAHGFSTHTNYMDLLEKNNAGLYYDVIMVPFNHKGAYVHSLTGQYSEWDQNRHISILTEAGNKGIGIVAMKTCSGGQYSPGSGIAPSYREAVKWVTQHNFISSAAVAMSSFEQIDEDTSWLS